MSGMSDEAKREFMARTAPLLDKLNQPTEAYDAELLRLTLATRERELAEARAEALALQSSLDGSQLRTEEQRREVERLKAALSSIACQDHNGDGKPAGLEWMAETCDPYWIATGVKHCAEVARQALGAEESTRG